MGLSWQLRQLSWPELRHHPWRHATAWFAVVLGVALAFSVQLINSSALGEFSAAVRSVNGQPDFELRAQRDGYDEALYGRVATHPQVALASPVIELETNAYGSDGQRAGHRKLKGPGQGPRRAFDGLKCLDLAPVPSRPAVSAGPWIVHPVRWRSSPQG